MGINLRLSSSANGTRNAGQGGGQFLITANVLSVASNASVTTNTIQRPAVSTADYYHTDGLSDIRPWDLLACGSPGAAIASAKGYRYVWFVTSDHSSNASGGEGGWGNDSTDLYVGFSNDPHIFPDASTLQCIKPLDTTIGIYNNFEGFLAWLVYNPDDATYPFYIYTEGGGSTRPSNGLSGVCYKTADFDTALIGASVSHPTTSSSGLTAYQRVYRLGTGNWVSWGGGSATVNDGSLAKWTSTDGQSFTIGSQIKSQISSSGTSVVAGSSDGWVKNFKVMGERFQIGSDWYVPCVEDLRGPGWSSGRTYAANEQVTVGLTAVTYKSLSGSNTNNDPTTSPVQWQNLGNLGQYVTLVPVDGTTGDLNFTGTPPMIRISDKYAGVYPSATYLQYVHNYIEDGICHIYAVHGFPNDTGLGSNASKLPEDGGGLNEQFIDIYAYVFDTTTAKNSAPLGVQAKCSGGVVTLSWADLPSGRSYRIKRGTDGVTFGTTVSSSVTGTTITDSPTVGSVYYYQVIALDAGTEKGARIVSTYVS